MIVDQLRELCARLLSEGTAQVVIGYGQAAPGKPAYPVFIRRAEDADQLVWNDQCMTNLAATLKRREVKALGKPAVIVKGCDERALIMLAKESQIVRANIYVIGVECNGAGRPAMAKCASCDVHVPRWTDTVIRETESQAAAVRTTPSSARYADLEAFMRKTPEARLAFWRAEFGRCVKCYACRQVCPLCYCERCIADKNRPCVIDTSATPKGNFAWHITRAFHLAARCAGCDECARACPAHIDLRLLNLALAAAAEDHFGWRAGMDPEAEPPAGAYSLKDKEDFIG
ncbi:MAG: Fe-S oxidoreductase [bacterium]|nr:4Fe-4S dicluster domain-containing protein [Candidatus Sumerlaeota bacterium]